MHEAGARTVISVVTPGGGATGIKALNDRLVGHALADRLFATRNQIVQEVFSRHGMTVVELDYKTATFAATRPPAEVAGALRTALAEIATRMRPPLYDVLRQGLAEARAKAATSSSAERAAATERIRNLEAEIARFDADPSATLALHVGAAEIHGGARASYEQILGARQNAAKAAILARDPSFVRSAGNAIGPNGLIYSEEQFVQLARETIALRDQLAKEQLPWNGRMRQVIAKGTLDDDLARAARKGEIDGKQLTASQRGTLARIETYMTRVNTLDYLTRFRGDELGVAGAGVGDALAWIRHLESDVAVSRELADQIGTALAGRVAQAGTASEAQFYQRATGTRDRIVLNADIKDLGLDVLRGNELAMEHIARTGRVAAASRSASDDVIKLKRGVIERFHSFYRDSLLPRARAELANQGRRDLLSTLDREQQPLLLLGGDELTLSLPRVFEELGLIPEVVDHLQSSARARVAVTRTGNVLDGARGHEAAMKASEDPHRILKRYEQLARDLQEVKSRLSHGETDEATRLQRAFEEAFTTTDEHGAITIRTRTGTWADGPSQSEARARQLIKKGRGHG